MTMPVQRVTVSENDHSRWKEWRLHGKAERAGALTRGPDPAANPLDRLAFYVGLIDDSEDPTIDRYAETLIDEAREARATWREIVVAMTGREDDEVAVRISKRLLKRKRS